jgi:hypothetical protein
MRGEERSSPSSILAALNPDADIAEHSVTRY